MKPTFRNLFQIKANELGVSEPLGFTEGLLYSGGPAV